MPEKNKQNNEVVNLSQGEIKGAEAVVPAREETPSYFIPSGTPKMVRWIIEYSGGLVKDIRQANYVLLGFSILAIIIAIFLFLKAAGIGRSPATPVGLPLPGAMEGIEQ